MTRETVGRSLEETKEKTREWLAGFGPESPLVLVPAFNAFDDTRECLDSLLAHTPAEVPVLLIDDASTDPRFLEYFERQAFKERLGYLPKPVNQGFVDSVNLGFELAGRRDVVIINSDVVVPSGWLARLRAAAYSGSTVATATPLTNHGGIISVPYRNEPVNELPAGLSLEEIDRRISREAARSYPALPTAVGHCIYFKRLALDLVGYFDQAFAPGYGEEVNFSQSARLLGLTNVLADDLFVYHKGSRSFNNAEARQRLRDSHDEIIRQRYPWYEAEIGEAMSLPDSPLALALQRARYALLGYHIGLDATCLDGTKNGTQVLTLELTQALARQKSDNVRLTLFTSDTAKPADLLGVEKLVDEVLTVSAVKKLTQPAFDLVHRPFQVYSLEDLELLQKVARRFVVTQLDGIAFATPAYAPDADWWLKLRHFTRLTFGASDGVIFISQEAHQETARQGLAVDEKRASVTYLGLDHQLHQSAPKAPREAEHLLERPFILMLGTNYHHKNRAFALRLFARLVEQTGWDGNLVFAGSNKAAGGSTLEEQQEIERHPALSGRNIDLGAVGEGEKQWLLAKAALLLYPSTVEGFGMVPFEAAQVGTPALTARTSSLAEVIGEDAVYLESFDPAEEARTVWQLLSRPEAAKRQVTALRERARNFTWAKVAQETLAFYRQILGQAPHLPQAINQQLAQYSELTQEYQKLQGWSAELNRQLVSGGKKRLLSWFKVYGRP